MARAVRVEFERAFYHVMARGDRREAIVRDEGPLCARSAEASDKSGLRVHAFVLMSNPLPSARGDPASESIPGDGLAAERLYATDQ
jgi:hypothetical protein